jgi:hypothetical protein
MRTERKGRSHNSHFSNSAMRKFAHPFSFVRQGSSRRRDARLDVCPRRCRCRLQGQGPGLSTGVTNQILFLLLGISEQARHQHGCRSEHKLAAVKHRAQFLLGLSNAIQIWGSIKVKVEPMGLGSMVIFVAWIVLGASIAIGVMVFWCDVTDSCKRVLQPVRELLAYYSKCRYRVF